MVNYDKEQETIGMQGIGVARVFSSPLEIDEEDSCASVADSETADADMVVGGIVIEGEIRH